MWFLTLGYPKGHYFDAETLERHLSCLFGRLGRAWPDCAAVSRKEYSKRGAPHFHLVMIVPQRMSGSLAEFRQWLARAWFEVCGTGVAEHLEAGTSVSRVRSWARVIGYMCKRQEYIPQEFDPETGELLSARRFWRVFNKSALPITVVQYEISRDEMVKLDRVFRRHARKRGGRGVGPGGVLCGRTAFLPCEQGRRLAEQVTNSRIPSSITTISEVIELPIPDGGGGAIGKLCLPGDAIEKQDETPDLLGDSRVWDCQNQNCVAKIKGATTDQAGAPSGCLAKDKNSPHEAQGPEIDRRWKDADTTGAVSRSREPAAGPPPHPHHPCAEKGTHPSGVPAPGRRGSGFQNGNRRNGGCGSVAQQVATVRAPPASGCLGKPTAGNHSGDRPA
jgi:hypothetical protein